MGWRYPIDPNNFLVLCLYLLISSYFVLSVLMSKNKLWVKIIGQIYFGMGIALFAGGIVAYDFQDDTTLFLIFSAIGMLTLLFGVFGKIKEKRLKSKSF